MAVASTLSMLIYAATLVVAWWREAGSGIAGSLIPTLFRSAMAAVLAGLAGRAVANSMFSVEDNPAVGLLTLIVAGAITVVVFLVTHPLVAMASKSKFLSNPKLSGLGGAFREGAAHRAGTSGKTAAVKEA